MLLAASYAGLGFGSAGVHLPHGMSYAVSGNVKTYRPAGYVTDHPLVPHGMSVVLNAPAVFRFTARASPDRHLAAAGALGADVSRAKAADAGQILADRITWTAIRLRTRILYSFERPYSGPSARSAPSRHCQPAKGPLPQAGYQGRALDWFMQRLKMPADLRALGYTPADIPALVEGTLPQHRVTKLSPRPAGPDELAALFEQAMANY